MLKSSLKSGKGTSSASELDADRILAELLRTKLKTATDKEAAIFQTFSTHVISPLFEQHLPRVLKHVRSELPRPTGEEQAGAALLLDQLLAAFTERALGASKVALLKRLSPIVSKAVGAGFTLMLSQIRISLSPDPDPTLSPNEALSSLTVNCTQERQRRRGHA